MIIDATNINLRIDNQPSLNTTIRLPDEGLLIYHFADGTQSDDTKMNWYQCPIHSLVALELHIIGKKHLLKREHHPQMIEFVQFKTATSRPGKTTCVSRSIGFTDGLREFIFEINAKNGEVTRKTYPGRVHLHPQSLKLVDIKKGIFEN